MAAMKPRRVRHQLFLPEDLSQRLEALAAKPEDGGIRLPASNLNCEGAGV